MRLEDIILIVILVDFTIGVILSFVGAVLSSDEKKKKAKICYFLSKTLLFLGVLSIFSSLILFPINKKYGTDNYTTSTEIVMGSRMSIVGRYTHTYYYITLSNGKEYNVSGKDYSSLHEGDEVVVYSHDITGCIFGNHYYFEDWG